MAKRQLKDLKVAIVCDWLTNVGGAERVVKSFHDMFPNAPIYTSQYDPMGIDWFRSADVRTGWLNKLPKTLRKFFPLLRGLYFSRLDLSQYDLVISSTGAEAKAVKTGPKTLHVSYMHAPTQYYWSLYDQYLERPGFGWLDPFVRVVLQLFVRPLRKTDKRYAARPDYIVSNSHYVQAEIKKYYGRDSVVVFPPVTVEQFSEASSQKRSGFVVSSRQVPWKRLDLAVVACREQGEKLVVVGDGSEHEKLVELAADNPSVSFLPTQDTASLAKIIGQSEGYIFPSLEPFGIAPVEALAAGTPVIAYGKGGALDYIKDGENGLLFEEQTVSSLVAALKKFRRTSFNEDVVKQSSASFSESVFRDTFIKTVTEWLKEHGKQR